MLKVAQNAKYDIGVLSRYGIEVAPIEDTMLISYVLEGGLHGHGMDELAKLWLGHEPIRFKTVAGTGKAQKSFKHVELDEADLLRRRGRRRHPAALATSCGPAWRARAC